MTALYSPLKINKPVEADVTAVSTAPIDAPRPALRALLAEDNETNQMVFGAFLSKFGVAHDIAPDGEAALARWRDTGYDVVLMDLHMPRLDGLEAIAAIRAEEKARGLSRTPIMLLSADTFPETRAAAMAAGADHVAMKPLDMAGLRAALCEMVGLDAAP